MADTLIFTTEKALKEAGDKITPDEKKPIEEKIEALRKVKDGTDIEVIKKATEELSQEAQKIGEKLYKAAQEEQKAKAGATQPEAGKTTSGEPVEPKEAETEKKEEKK